MTSIPDAIAAWQMVQPPIRNSETGATTPGRLELVEIPVPELAPGEVLVEIAGCGVSEADLGCFYDGLAAASTPPLTLGHEIAGTVVAGEPSWLGQEVVIMTVKPCGRGIHGGYASHIPAVAGDLCAIPHRRHTIPLEYMAAVAGTVATAFQAVCRAAIAAGDKVIVIGAGETGPFVVQMARIFGAATVLVVDNGVGRLRPLLSCGADVVVDVDGETPEATAAEVRHLRANGLPATGWKIFETTGTGAGREIALALLDRADKLILTGSQPAVEAAILDRCFTAGVEIIATRGCPPEDYPRVVDLVTSGRIVLSPFVQTRPMSWIREVFAAARPTPPDRHIILTTDDLGLDYAPEPKSCR